MTNQLPAHLLALFGSNPGLSNVGENIRNESHAKILFSGKKWRMKPVSGEEIAFKPKFLLNDKNEPIAQINAVDIIIVDINEHKSHIVYAQAFKEGEEQAPIWSSDDGTPVPVEHETKVVTDYRRVAVIVADNLEGGIFELRVPAASLTNFDRYNTTIRNYGVPIGSLITRVSFDDAFDYPKLTFTPSSYLDEQQAEALGKAFANREQVQMIIGTRKRAALAAPIEQAALPAPMVSAAIAEAKPEEIKTTRTRTKKVETAPAPIVHSVTIPVVPVTQPSAPIPAAAMPISAASAVVTAPKASDSQLDALLANIMNKK